MNGYAAGLALIEKWIIGKQTQGIETTELN